MRKAIVAVVMALGLVGSAVSVAGTPLRPGISPSDVAGTPLRPGISSSQVAGTPLRPGSSRSIN